jgi:hypothetical protein
MVKLQLIVSQKAGVCQLPAIDPTGFVHTSVKALAVETKVKVYA